MALSRWSNATIRAIVCSTISEEEILRDHVAHCVEQAVVSGSRAEQQRKIAELMDVVSRADR